MTPAWHNALVGLLIFVALLFVAFVLALCVAGKDGRP